MKVTMKLMRVGTSMQEATIAEWFKQPGETFTEGERLYSFETDKVIQEVTATAPGKLVEVFVRAGQEAAVGARICLVDINI